MLRHPRRPRALDAEAVLMRHVRAAGYPVPDVFEVRPEGMVMELIAGRTMLDDLAAHPWRVAATPGRWPPSIATCHPMPARDGSAAPFGPAAPGDVVVHGNSIPDNVLLSAAGPVVVDWSNGGRGPAGADVADAWLALGTGRPGQGGALLRVAVAVLRRRFLAVFLRHAGRADAARHLATALERQLVGDRNLAEAEKAAMRRIAARHGR